MVREQRIPPRRQMKHQTAEKKKKEQVQTDATDDGDKKKGKQEDKAKGKNENHILDDDEITDDDGRAENQAHDSSAILEDIGPGFGDCKVETSSGDEAGLAKETKTGNKRKAAELEKTQKNKKDENASDEKNEKKKPRTAEKEGQKGKEKGKLDVDEQGKDGNKKRKRSSVKSKEEPTKGKKQQKASKKGKSGGDDADDADDDGQDDAKGKKKSTKERSSSKNEPAPKKQKTTAKPKSAKKTGVPPSFFIVLSALSVENRTTLSDIASPLGGAQVLHHDFVPDKATHLVSGGNKRTVKLLQALAKGIWVLKSDWIYDSMEAGKWLPEEGYEAVDWFPGAKASRLARAHQKKGLLHQIAIMVCGGVRVPLHSLERAIELAGGQCTKSYRNTDYCIVAENAIYKPWVEKFPKERAVPIVKEDWLLDSLKEYKLLPVESYRISTEPPQDTEETTKRSPRKSSTKDKLCEAKKKKEPTPAKGKKGTKKTTGDGEKKEGEEEEQKEKLETPNPEEKGGSVVEEDSEQMELQDD